jgi:hypothetical protein
MRMKQTIEQRHAREGGQTLVEFALVIVILLMVMFAIIDFSRLFFAYGTMANGVREGARYAIIHPDDLTGIEERTRAMMVVIGGSVTIEIEYPDTGDGGNPHCSHYCRVVVRATSDLDVWTPIIPAIEVVTQSTMHIE